MECENTTWMSSYMSELRKEIIAGDRERFQTMSDLVVYPLRRTLWREEYEGR